MKPQERFDMWLSEKIIRLATKFVPTERQSNFLASQLSLNDEHPADEKVGHAFSSFRHVSWILQQHYQTDFTKMLLLEGYTSHLAVLMRIDQRMSPYPKVKFFLQACGSYLATLIFIPFCVLIPLLTLTLPYDLVAAPERFQQTVFLVVSMVLINSFILFFGAFHHFAGEAHNRLLQASSPEGLELTQLSSYRALMYFYEDDPGKGEGEEAEKRTLLDQVMKKGVQWAFQACAFIPMGAFKSCQEYIYTDTGPAVWARLKDKTGR